VNYGGIRYATPSHNKTAIVAVAKDFMFGP
jgi:hypothetical protein